MREYIHKHLKENGFHYVDLVNEHLPEEYVLNVHNLFSKGIEDVVQNGVVLTYYGLYYKIQGNDVKVVKYYSMAIKLGGINAMHNLALHYSKHNHDLTVKYYLMAIDHNSVSSMYNLACYFHERNDYENAKKYYLMAVSHNHSDAINNLAACYYAQHDYANAIKYGLLAINHNASITMGNLAQYYLKDGDFVSALKYFSMAVDCGDYKCVHDALILCEIHWFDDCARYVNKVLNKQFNGEIIDVIQCNANNMNQDLVNIIINIDVTGTEYDNSVMNGCFARLFGTVPLFTKFKNLLV